MSRAWLLLASLIAACGGSAVHDGGPRPGEDGGLGDGDIPRDDNPITARPSRDTHQCRIERDRTDHSPRHWSVHPPALVQTTAGKTFLVRPEFITTDPYAVIPPPSQLVVSTFDVAGTFGPATTIPIADQFASTSVAAAPRGDGFLAVWIDDQKLWLAGFDAAGQVVLPPRKLLDDVDNGASPELVAGPDGNFGLVYAPELQTEVVRGSRQLRFAVLDATGTFAAPPRALTLPGAGFASPAAALTATATGYAMIWRDPASMSGGIDFASASASGDELVARHRVSAPVGPGLVVGGASGFDSPRTALLARGDGFLAAWTEARRGDFGGAGSVVRLARLDGQGNRLGDAASLRSFQADVDEVEPTLIPFGDAVAVLWGRGSHTYVCAGCVPDHRIDLVLLDPATLTPLSNLVSLTNGGDPQAGGLLRHRAAVVGGSLLVPYLLTFHTRATPESAAFACAKK